MLWFSELQGYIALEVEDSGLAEPEYTHACNHCESAFAQHLDCIYTCADDIRIM